MNGSAAVMAVVLFIFFILGIGVGILTVLALSAHRADKASRWHRGTSDGNWPYADEGDPDESDESPWWQARDGE